MSMMLERWFGKKDNKKETSTERPQWALNLEKDSEEGKLVPYTVESHRQPIGTGKAVKYNEIPHLVTSTYVSGVSNSPNWIKYIKAITEDETEVKIKPGETVFWNPRRQRQ